MKKRVNASIYIFSPEFPRLFFLSSLLKFHPPFLSPHLNAGRRFTFFNLSQRSSIYWMSWLAFGLALISNFSSTIYHFLLFRCSSICWIVKSRIFLTSTSHIVFLSSSRSSICWIKFWTRMLEKNTRTTLLLHQHPSCLVLFDSGASSFFSLKHASSFSSSIFLPSSSSLIFPSQASSTRELPLSMKLHLQRRISRDTRGKKFLACIRLSALPWVSFPIRC